MTDIIVEKSSEITGKHFSFLKWETNVTNHSYEWQLTPKNQKKPDFSRFNNCLTFKEQTHIAGKPHMQLSASLTQAFTATNRKTDMEAFTLETLEFLLHFITFLLNTTKRHSTVDIKEICSECNFIKITSYLRTGVCYVEDAATAKGPFPSMTIKQEVFLA